MRKRILFPMAIVLILMCLAGFAEAGRVLTMPSADVSDRQLALEYDFYRGEHRFELQSGVYPGILVGLRQQSQGEFSLIAKAAVLGESGDWPGLALGGELSYKTRSIYAVLSKQLGSPALRGHLAFGTGRYASGMAGLSLMLNPVQTRSKGGLLLPTFLLAAEYDGKGLNSGLVVEFSPAFSGYLAFSGAQSFGIGFNFTAEF